MIKNELKMEHLMKKHGREGFIDLLLQFPF